MILESRIYPVFRLCLCHLRGRPILTPRNAICRGDLFAEPSISEQHIEVNDGHPEQYERLVDVSHHVHKAKLKLHPDSPEHSKVLRIAVLGTPNAGKSVLVNSLVGCNVSAVSKKVHTTQKMINAVDVEDDTQMIYFDTPGVVSLKAKKKHKLDGTMLKDMEVAITQARFLCIVVDVMMMTRFRKIYHRLLHLLHRYRTKPSVLVINKIDLLKDKRMLLELSYELTNGMIAGKPIERVDIAKEWKKSRLPRRPDLRSAEMDGFILSDDDEAVRAEQKEKLLEQVRRMKAYEAPDNLINKCFRDEKGWSNFDAVFMVSALTGDGIDELKAYLLSKASEGHWPYHSSLLTEQKPLDVVINMIRSRLLEHVGNQIPYTADIKVVVWEVNEHDVLQIMVKISAKTHGEQSIIMGRGGYRIQQISTEANQELSNLFQKDVHLRIEVTSDK